MSNFDTTAGRKTRIRLDVSDRISVYSAWGNTWNYDEIGLMGTAAISNCMYLPGIGWKIRPVQASRLGVIHELQIAQGAIIQRIADGGTLQVGPTVSTKYSWRDTTELNGTTSASGVTIQGDPFLTRRPNTDWSVDDIGIRPDISTASSYYVLNGPDITYNKNLVRLAVNGVAEDGTKPIMFRFATATSSLSSPDVICILYFVGPPAADGRWRGNGNYAMVFRGDGSWDLYENGINYVGQTAGYWHVSSGRYCDSNTVTSAQHRIIIFPYFDPRPSRSKNMGKLSIFTSNGNDPMANHSKRLGQAYVAGDLRWNEINIPFRPSEAVPQPPQTPPVVTPSPIRVTQRADIKTEFQLSYLTFGGPDNTDPNIPTGNIIVPFNIPATLAGDTLIKVSWQGGLIPGAASGQVSIALFDGLYEGNGDVHNTALPGITPTTYGYTYDNTGTLTGGFAFFNPYIGADNFGSNFYKARFILYGQPSDSPYIKRVQVAIDGKAIDITPGEFTLDWPCVVTSISITGPENDMTHETASVYLADLGNQYGLLKTRGDFATRIDTEYNGVDWENPANEGKQSVIFDGYMIKSPAHRTGTQNMPVALGSATQASYPAPNWNSYNGLFIGKWKRLYEAISPFNWDFSLDPNTGEPPYVVDVIAEVLSWAGLTDDMIDIGEGTSADSEAYPIRLFTGANDVTETAITAGTRIYDFASRLAIDYLGAALIWDANSTSESNSSWGGDYTTINGCIRLIGPKGSPYNTLCKFISDPPTNAVSGAVLLHTLQGYDVIVSGDQTIAVCPIIKDTLDEFTNPPEFNKIIVTGTGELNNARSKVPDLLTVFAVNTSSYNYLDSSTAPSSGEDYLGREVIAYVNYNRSIQTPEAAKWVCRRYYDLLAHAVHHKSFTAPLVLVTDSTDDRQKRPRPLRFYDFIQFEGEDYLVRNCNPFYDKDGHQLAHYEIQSIPPAYIVPIR